MLLGEGEGRGPFALWQAALPPAPPVMRGCQIPSRSGMVLEGVDASSHNFTQQHTQRTEKLLGKIVQARFSYTLTDRRRESRLPRLRVQRRAGKRPYAGWCLAPRPCFAWRDKRAS